MKAAEVAATGTVTDAGTGRAPGLFEVSVTRPPPVGAAWFNVTVHVVAAPEVKLVGLHTSEDTARLGVTVTVAVALPPSVAVTIAF